MPIAQFAPLSSLVQPALWHKLSDLKIDVLKLSDAAVPIHGSYTAGRSVKDRESGQEISLPCNLTVGADSFEDNYRCVDKDLCSRIPDQHIVVQHMALYLPLEH